MLDTSRESIQSVELAVDVQLSGLAAMAGEEIKKLIYPALAKKTLNPKLKLTPYILARALITLYFENESPFCSELYLAERRKLQNLYNQTLK